LRKNNVRRNVAKIDKTWPRVRIANDICDHLKAESKRKGTDFRTYLDEVLRQIMPKSSSKK
jgi:hypothetical protein